MKLTSPRFLDGQSIPKSFSGEGRDISPPLEWSDIPARTRSFVLLCEDPDAPIGRADHHQPFAHWLVYGISPTTSALPAGLPNREAIEVPILASQGRNSFGTIGYGGPLPPLGHGPQAVLHGTYERSTADRATRATGKTARSPRVPGRGSYPAP